MIKKRVIIKNSSFRSNIRKNQVHEINNGTFEKEYINGSNRNKNQVLDKFRLTSKLSNKQNDITQTIQSNGNGRYNKIPLHKYNSLRESNSNDKSNHNSNGNLSKISTGFFSREFKENQHSEKEKEFKITLSNSFRKNHIENRSVSRKESLSIENKGDESEIRSKILIEKNRLLEDQVKNLKFKLEQEKKVSRKCEEDVRRNNYSNGLINIKDLEILREKVTQMEMENEHLVFKHEEESKKQAEHFTTFVKICRKYLSKIKSINELLAKLEQKNIRSILENKNKINKEISKIIDDFDSVVNNPGLFRDFANLQFQNKILEKLEESNSDDVNKIFNFIDHIAKLETANQRLLEQNEALNRKIKNETINYEEKLNEEFTRLQRKIMEEKLQKEECNNALLYIKQLNKELENKVDSLAQENIVLRKSTDKASEKDLEVDFLKRKCLKLENEINYKESIISYLENLLKSNKNAFNNEEGYSTPNRNNPDFYKNEKMDQTGYENSANITNEKITFKGLSESKDLKGQNFNYISNDSNINFYDCKNFLTLDPENKTKTLEYSTPVRNGDLNQNTISFNSGLIISENHNFNSITRNNSLKNEIDNLDLEIKVLQKKLKVMIDDKRK